MGRKEFEGFDMSWGQGGREKQKLAEPANGSTLA